MYRKLLSVVFLGMIVLSSCTKTRGSKEACFTISKSSVKVGDTLYLFNCSKNYDNQIWFMPDGTQRTSRHATFIPTNLGTYPITLRIGDYLMLDTISTNKTFDVIN